MPLVRTIVVIALFAAVALADWPMYQHDPAHTAIAVGTTINAGSVARLAEVWKFTTGDWVTGTPIVVDGTVYIGSWDGNFYALRETDGQRLWSFNVGRTSDNCGATYGIDATAAYSDGKVYVPAANCDLYSLDAATGREIFRTHLADPTQGFHLWSSPVVFEGNIYVGLASHCDHPCVRGQIVCLSASDGRVLWTFYAAPTGGVGAGVWSSMAIDESRRLVYASTGNYCQGDDTYGNAIVALDVGTGALIWHYKNINRDSENLDFGASPVLFDAGVPALAVGSKDGHCYALNRVTGQLLWNTRVTDGSTVGGIISSPAAGYGLVFMGSAVGGNQTGKVVALDQRDGRIVWEAPQTRPVIGPAALADGVLLIGGADGDLRAYDPLTGEKLWSASIGPVLGGISIEQDRIFAGSVDHSVHAFKLGGALGNQPPRASIRASAVFGPPPLTVAFDADASDPDGRIIAYSWEFGDGSASSEQSVSHTYAAAGNFTVRLRVTDDGGATASDSLTITVSDSGGGPAAQSVVWKNVVGCNAIGSSLVKTSESAWGNAGASSEQVIQSGEGYVEFTATETNRERMCGLSNIDADQDYSSITFAIHLNTGGAFHVFESGRSRGYFGDFRSGDVFRVAVQGGVVRYYRNGAVFYTSGFAPRYPLIADAALNGTGATITNATISTSPAGPSPPAVEVLAPNGGEKLRSEGSASTFTIRWSATGGGLTRFDVYLSLNAGKTWQEIALGISVPSTTHAWTVPNVKTKKGRIRVVAHTADGQTAEDESDSNFVIKRAPGTSQ
ncbi:MAG TPA: PQQ-binding-like beta-propeller repeat protein [Blastocatellia bacterium]|nr:PQQ-binding-like beta-propeller repeat protein [Blastocatellia bacterium]